tara:strand:- start:87 stop:605 length:519 start_codon:yes stop_codon:yes gene_type:complete
MSTIDKYYHKIKYLILEYDNILLQDIQYMNDYLKYYGNDLNINNNNLVDKYNTELLKNDEIFYDKTEIDSISKLFYKPLAKLLHPDKNNNKSEEFIKINKAYEKNDYLTLFIYYYESKIDIKISNDIISHIKQKIVEKKQEIENIKKKIHWKWALSNDIEKVFIQEYVKNQI